MSSSDIHFPENRRRVIGYWTPRTLSGMDRAEWRAQCDLEEEEKEGGEEK